MKLKKQKQNVTQCLTYIRDKCFNFFLILDSKIRQIMTIENFKLHKSQIFEKCRSYIRNDNDLHKIWRDICGKTITYQKVFTSKAKTVHKRRKELSECYQKEKAERRVTKKQRRNTIPDAIPSTSEEATKKKTKQSKTPSKGKGKGKSKSKKYYCGLCYEEYNINEDWIQCDGCNIWYHRMSETAFEMRNNDANWRLHQQVI